jgi:hypothetical protein
MEILTEVMETVLGRLERDMSHGRQRGLPLFLNSDGRPVGAADDVWCYGRAGLIHPLAEAAKATGRPQVQGLAANLLQTALDAPESSIREPMLCHGLAGTLQTAVRAARRGMPIPEQSIDRLVSAVLIHYDSQSKTGFSDLSDVGDASDTSLLTGTVGIALALMSVVSDVDPTWDRILAMS